MECKPRLFWWCKHFNPLARKVAWSSKVSTGLSVKIPRTTALKDSPHRPPTDNRHQLPTANCQLPTANRQPLFKIVVLCLAHVLTMKQRAFP